MKSVGQNKVGVEFEYRQSYCISVLGTATGVELVLPGEIYSRPIVMTPADARHLAELLNRSADWTHKFMMGEVEGVRWQS